MSRLFILPYRKGSKSVEFLYRGLEDLNVKMIRMENSKYRSREGDVVINWGNSQSELDFSKATVLNPPENLGYVTNKLNFFRRFDDVDPEIRPRLPEWTQDSDVVASWVGEGKTVFARTKLTGHSGEGIVPITPEEGYDPSNFKRNTLYTKYVKKKSEYRLHFFRGEIVDVQRKARRHDVADPNWLIRSHDNGFVYSRNDVGEVPEDVTHQATLAIQALNLDFGAIDVIYNKLHNEATVLEVNTACGLEGTTAQLYVDRFRAFVEGL